MDECAHDLNALEKCLELLDKGGDAIGVIFGLIIQIGNYLNYGSTRGAAFGFSLDSLPMIARTSSFKDKQYSLAHFL